MIPKLSASFQPFFSVKNPNKKEDAEENEGSREPDESDSTVTLQEKDNQPSDDGGVVWLIANDHFIIGIGWFGS